LRNWQSHS